MAARMSNKALGNKFERELAETLSKNGYWVHRMIQSQVGQPFDLLVAKNGETFPIDCKVCENDIFPFSRIEPNQVNAMTLWRETGNGNGFFALKLNDGSVYILTFYQMQELSALKSALSRTDIIEYGSPLEDWLCV